MVAPSYGGLLADITLIKVQYLPHYKTISSNLNNQLMVSSCARNILTQNY